MEFAHRVGSLLLEIARMAAVLDAYIYRAGLARQLNRNERILERWASQGTGPAITRIGKSPHYRNDIVHAWLLAMQEELSLREFCEITASRTLAPDILKNRYNEK